MVEMSTSDQEFDFFFQLNAVICPMSMISMEVSILGHVSFGWVCNTPKYTLVVFDMFRVFFQRKFNCFIS